MKRKDWKIIVGVIIYIILFVLSIIADYTPFIIVLAIPLGIILLGLTIFLIYKYKKKKSKVEYEKSIDKLKDKDELITYGEKHIERCAFRNRKDITSVIIPDNVTSIGDYAFQGCSNLTKIYIPDSVTKIGFAAFKDCVNLNSVTIQNGAVDIGLSIFEGCKNLEKVIMPTNALYECMLETTKLKTVVINGGKKIEDSTFVNQTNLTSIKIADSVKRIGNSAFLGCSSLSEIIIPDSVIFIDDEAFASCSNLKKIVLSNNLQHIGDNIFEGCSPIIYTEYENAKYLGSEINPYIYLAKANKEFNNENKIHNNTKFIGSYAFANCNNFNEIKLPDSVSHIGSGAFGQCESINIERGKNNERKIHFVRIEKNI